MRCFNMCEGECPFCRASEYANVEAEDEDNDEEEVEVRPKRRRLDAAYVPPRFATNQRATGVRMTRRMTYILDSSSESLESDTIDEESNIDDEDELECVAAVLAQNAFDAYQQFAPDSEPIQYIPSEALGPDINGYEECKDEYEEYV
jgi:hypothetical protein